MSAQQTLDAELDAIVDGRPIARIGYAIIGVFIVLFLVWSATMPLSTAAIASGIVGVDGNRKQIQHQSGGLVKMIHVRNGDIVDAGAPLLTLDDVTSRSGRDILIDERIQLTIEQASWNAILNGEAFIQWPQSLDELVDDDSRSQIKRVQQKHENLFRSHQNLMRESMRTLLYERQQANEQRGSADRQLAILLEKQILVEAEMNEYQQLAQQGLTTRVERFELEKDRADLVLNIDQTRSAAAQALQMREQARSKIEVLTRTAERDAAEKIIEIDKRLAALEQELHSISMQLSRTVIKAPIDGQVLNSTIFTVGGVAPAGSTLMELMPINQTLLIESLVDHKDRDSIHVGQAAEVRFTALNRKSTTPVAGIVKTIAADSAVGPGQLEPRFAAVIELDDSALALIETGRIHPGMQAEVIIITGKQTLLDYLISPIASSFNRALRES